MKSIHALILILFVLGLAACGLSPASVDPAADLEGHVSQLPGAHLSLSPTPPTGFESVPLVRIYTKHRGGEDIWLHASPDAMAGQDSDGKLRAWLQAIQALSFPQEDALLYWIPADLNLDRLGWLQDQDLLERILPSQGAYLWKQRGDALRRENDFAAAIDAYQASLALQPEGTESLAGLGAAYLGLGQHEAAITPLRRVIEINPDDYWGHRLLGNAYLNVQRYALAADAYTQAYLLRPDSPQILLGIALGYGRSGRPQLGLSILEQLSASTTDPRLLSDAETLRQEFNQVIDPSS